MDSEKDSPVLIRLKNHVRRRLLLGLVVFAPFGLTFYVLLQLVGFGKDLLTAPIIRFLNWTLHHWAPHYLSALQNPETGNFHAWIEYTGLTVSILLVLFLLYLIGILSATFFGRRYIAMGERVLMRIPGVPFCYNTIKHVVEIVSRPRSRAFKKVVIIEYPRKGVRGVAFFSGLTFLPEQDKVLINVFIPTTPNPTSGFLLLLDPGEVWDTNLTMSEATRFIISGGVVAIENLQTRSFPIEEYQEEIDERRRRALRRQEEGVSSAGVGTPAIRSESGEKKEGRDES